MGLALNPKWSICIFGGLEVAYPYKRGLNLQWQHRHIFAVLKTWTCKLVWNSISIEAESRTSTSTKYLLSA